MEYVLLCVGLALPKVLVWYSLLLSPTLEYRWMEYVLLCVGGWVGVEEQVKAAVPLHGMSPTPERHTL
jgi:hypothetical protein